MKVQKSILKAIISEINSLQSLSEDRRPSFILNEPKQRCRFNSVNIQILKDRHQIARIFKEMKPKVTPAEGLRLLPKEARVILADPESAGSIRYFDRPTKKKRLFAGKKRMYKQQGQAMRKFSLHSDWYRDSGKQERKRRQRKQEGVSGFIENKGNIFGSVKPEKNDDFSKNEVLRKMELPTATLNFNRKGSAMLVKSGKKSSRKYSEITERAPHFGFTSAGAKNTNRKKKKKRKKKKSMKGKRNAEKADERNRESSEEDEDYYTQHILNMCRK